ncbi:hypothetical protein ACFVT9_37325 [Kitasatospora cineracea]|uniref:hypothetical protein n=1 Tax=Kitasatospora cineracea TaxID=88074 RepID=UPI0036DB8130
MIKGGERLGAAVAGLVLLWGLAACTSNGSGQPPAGAVSSVPSAAASPSAGTPEWAAKFIGDTAQHREASKVVGRYAQLHIVQAGGRQGDTALCDAEWAKLTPAQKLLVDPEGFDEGCRVPA